MTNYHINTWADEDKRIHRVSVIKKTLVWASLVGFCLVFWIVVFSCLSGCACASELVDGYTIDEWVTAIGKAENSKTHPYGVMTRYKHTSAKQACANTIRHYWHDYCTISQSKRFLAYLQEHYAPIGVSNDPHNLNRHWQTNVLYYLRKEEKCRI